jgi:hypothetical protein
MGIKLLIALTHPADLPVTIKTGILAVDSLSKVFSN